MPALFVFSPLALELSIHPSSLIIYGRLRWIYFQESNQRDWSSLSCAGSGRAFAAVRPRWWLTAPPGPGHSAAPGLVAPSVNGGQLSLDLFSCSRHLCVQPVQPFESAFEIAPRSISSASQAPFGSAPPFLSYSIPPTSLPQLGSD